MHSHLCSFFKYIYTTFCPYIQYIEHLIYYSHPIGMLNISIYALNISVYNLWCSSGCASALENAFCGLPEACARAWLFIFNLLEGSALVTMAIIMSCTVSLTLKLMTPWRFMIHPKNRYTHSAYNILVHCGLFDEHSWLFLTNCSDSLAGIWLVFGWSSVITRARKSSWKFYPCQNLCTVWGVVADVRLSPRVCTAPVCWWLRWLGVVWFLQMVVPAPPLHAESFSLFTSASLPLREDHRIHRS